MMIGGSKQLSGGSVVERKGALGQSTAQSDGTDGHTVERDGKRHTTVKPPLPISIRTLDTEEEGLSPGEPVVPVYVMLPLDTVDSEGVFKYKSSPWFRNALLDLINSGIHGVAVDVWWGAVEKKPRVYDFTGYEELFEFLMSLNLKVQVVLSFHACGGNVGDTAVIPLPSWVLASGERDPDIFYTDRPRALSPGNRNPECISLFADDESGILRGRSPTQCYVDFMKAFRDTFLTAPGREVYYESISEIVVGMGPCGELRYPSYAETNGWQFPGIGEFQCYDRRALASLASAAVEVGRPEWGHGGPQDVGDYNSMPDETVFFRDRDGTWDTDYGHFFLNWYSQALLDHGDRMLRAASSVFNVLELNTPRDREEGNKICIRRYSGSEELLAYDEAEDLPLPIEVDSLQILTSQDSETRASDERSDGVESLPTHSMTALERQGSRGGGNGFAKSRGPSYASFKSSASVSDGLNSMEEWVWPTPSGKKVKLSIKIAGVHWWFHAKSRPAELTAGYKGYKGILSLCAKFGAGLTLTCVEMCDSQHPPEALCGPEGLLREVKEAACSAGVPLAGENALPCFTPSAIDKGALQRIVYNTQQIGLERNWNEFRYETLDQFASLPKEGGTSPIGEEFKEEMKSVENQALDDDNARVIKAQSFLPSMRSFTFLRLTPDMTGSETYQNQWNTFMKLMSRNDLLLGKQKLESS
jgi:hypothetical protein